MSSLIIVSVSGWFLTVLFIMTSVYPFVLRSGWLGPVQPFLVRMRLHYWLGYSIAAITLVHAFLSMSGAIVRHINNTGLYLATVALLLICVQVVVGRRLSWPKLSLRRVVRRWHFWVMVAISVFVVGHVVLNSGVLQIAFIR